MKESFLHYIWQHQRFNFSELQLTDCSSLRIQDFGFPDHADGPDFKMAKIFIDEVMFVGNIEIHVKSSDWHHHQHASNNKYKNVILHVVYENDKTIYYPNGELIPTLELKGKISKSLLESYQRLSESSAWIPCAPIFDRYNIDKFVFWKERLLIERIEEKIDNYDSVIKNDFNGSLEHFLIAKISYCLGLKSNESSMYDLIKKIPFNILKKTSGDSIQMQGLLLGVSGLLPVSSENVYIQQLIKEGKYQLHKHQLYALTANEWAWGGVRPTNFPTLRIVQLADLLCRVPHFFNLAAKKISAKEIQDIFTVQLDEYWDTHYTLDGEQSSKKRKNIGSERQKIIVINAIVPILFYLSKFYHDAAYQDIALELLELYPHEQNSIIEQWKTLGINAKSAADSQALLQLKKQYCNSKKCLSCQIGFDLLQKHS